MKRKIKEILGIDKPIIQGPLNWLTDAHYVSAVSNAGGLGVLGLNAGERESAKNMEERINNMRREIRRVRTMTDKPFGLNVAPQSNDPALDKYTEAWLQLMVEEKVKIVILVGDLAPYWIGRFKDHGIVVVFRALQPTVDNTKAAIDAGADIIVATGFDEGGTVPYQGIGTFSIVPLIVDAAEGRVPVFAAGGIADARTAKAAFALGADGLYVGTAFMMAIESPLAHGIKVLAVEANANDLVMYRTVPAFYRSLPGELPNKLLAMSKAGATEEELFEAQNTYVGMRDGMLFGDLSKGYASFGLGISVIHSIRPVAEIIDELMKGVPA